MNNKIRLCKKVVQFINEQELSILGKITLSQIAKNFNVSPEYLSRVFNKTMDTKLNFYFLRIKLIKSALLLHQEPSLTIKEISKISGFSDVNYYNKVFKVHIGTSPTVFSPFKK